MSIKFLKVKIKSLGEEQRIISREEQAALKRGRFGTKHGGMPGDVYDAYQTHNGLRFHRLGIKPEIRAALLAYGFLRGVPYRCIENAPRYLKAPYSKVGPNWKRVSELLVKYGPSSEIKSKDRYADALKLLEAWRDAPLAKAA